MSAPEIWVSNEHEFFEWDAVGRISGWLHRGAAIRTMERSHQSDISHVAVSTIRLILTLAALSGVSIHPAVASSIALRDGSTDWIVNAFAGDTAKAYDASTVFSNPAGLTRLNWNETDLSFSVVAPSSHFSGTNTIGGQLTPGSQGGNFAQPFLIPSVFAAWNFSPDLKFGLAVSAPFGARLAYPEDFVGRYQSLVSNLSSVQLSLAAAYRINNHLSIGGGPVINFLSVRLMQAVNLGPLSSAFGDPVAAFNGSSVGVGSHLARFMNSTTPSARASRFDLAFNRPSMARSPFRSPRPLLLQALRLPPLCPPVPDQLAVGFLCPTASTLACISR